MSILGDPVVLVNRTTKPLTFKANGRDFVLKPGKNYGYNSGHAEFAYKQHPLPGTQDYQSLQFISLVGIMREDGTVLYDCEEIPDSVIESAVGKEPFDLETLPPSAKAGRTKEKGRYLSGRDAATQATANAVAQGV